MPPEYHILKWARLAVGSHQYLLADSQYTRGYAVGTPGRSFMCECCAEGDEGHEESGRQPPAGCSGRLACRGSSIKRQEKGAVDLNA